MSSEITESARAVQEVAKAAQIGVEATRELVSFASSIMRGPLQSTAEILDDKLKFVRAELCARYWHRLQEILREKQIEGALRLVPPRLVLPIIENASLEDNDELQDLWANLLASAVDPTFKGTIRSAFVDIIKQLDVLDVHILDAIYNEMMTKHDNNKEAFANYLSRCLITPSRVVSKLNIELQAYENSIDNLLRLRLVSSNVGYQRYSAGESYATSAGDLLNHTDYDLVCMTPLGLSFIETCVDRGRRS